MMLRSGSKNQFYSILRDIEENQESTHTVDFSYFKLQGQHIEQLLDALAFNESVEKITLGKIDISPATLATLKGNDREVVFLHHVQHKRKRDAMFNDFPPSVPHQNHPRSLQFETELARCIIDNSSFAILYRINRAIINYFRINRYADYHTKTDEQQRKACVKLGYIKENDTNNNFIDLFIQLLQDRSGDIAQCITLHKIFVEDYLKPDDIIVRRAANAAKVQSLAYLCLLALQKNNIWELADDFLFILRPCSQFSPFNRGRIQTGKSSRTDDFGITEKEDCPEWAANWHYTPIFPAKDEFEPDMNSTTIRFFNKHQIPFIAGPSGTAANCLRGALLLLPLSPGEIKEYLNLIAAAEIAQGNHSFYEAMMIGSNLKIFHKLEACNDNVLISAVPKINMRNLYADCLTDEVKNCADYQALAEEYPDYLPETSSLHELKRKRL